MISSPEKKDDPKLDAELDVYVSALLGRKARNPVLLDVRPLTSIADAFLICHGTSTRQVSAIAEHVQRALKKQGIKALSVEGLRDGHWVLMDYGHVLIHVFYESTRQFYDLEGLWADARRIRTPGMEKLIEDEGAPDDEDVGASFFID
ncbi:ribosome silencing factor [Desulfosarcina sp. OttesenSCG-928-A07]|nr:ribosome silencing factor [Desulfosarcina sp. OttesenSCG-928-G17]MDL2328304.1 ribosome silencing factor [Desulfosarcina sp. OttesenSCG-928-A07]